VGLNAHEKSSPSNGSLEKISAISALRLRSVPFVLPQARLVERS